MAEPVRQDYPRSEIIEHHAEFQQLLLDMAKRSAGGKTTSGRYKKYDSTRLLFLNTIAFPSLRLGKRIDPKDWRLLFLPITSRDDPGTCADKDELDRWCALHKKDPRSKSSQSYGLDTAKQTSILSWVANNTAGYLPPAQAPAGRPHGYTLNFGAYAGCTLSQLARDGISRKLKPNATVPGGPTLLWITSPSFTWRFPQHVALFLALLELERSGCHTHGNSGEELINARHARAAYEQYARPDLEPRDDDREVLAVDDEIDPNLFERVGAAFETMNKISPAQRAFFERTVREMEIDPYDKWTSLWKRAPDATLLDNTTFDQAVADGYELLDVFFWSPSRLKQWRKLGVVMPCALHGWMHADKVTVKQRWACRLVKDITHDFILAGQECVCSECRKEHDQLNKHYLAAKSAGVNESILGDLKAKVDAVSYNWMTYDPRINAYYQDRFPFVALKLPAVVTHKAALSTAALWLLTHTAPKQTGHGLEDTLTVFRSLQKSVDTLSFYSLQRSWAQRPQVVRPTAPHVVVHLPQCISSVSDTYINTVIETWYFNDVERYLLLWFEQHCPLDVVKSDHHCKYSSRLREDGKRAALTNVLKVMNSWGGVPGCVFTESTSYNDPSAVRMFDNLREAAKRHGHPEPHYAVLDNPHKDGPGLCENLWLGGGKKRFLFPGEITVVVSEEECDSACRDLNDGNDGSELYWDTESVAYLDGSGENTSTAALVQICSGDRVCYLFRVALWSACYPSFTQLMANNQHKVAHFVGHDKADLQRRFPALVINGAVDLKERIGCLSLSSHALHKMIDQQFSQWLDKRCDHRLWACAHLLATHKVYAATDAYAVMRLAEAARAQGPTPLVRPAAAEDDLSEDEAPQPTRAPATTISRRRSQRSDRAANMTVGSDSTDESETEDEAGGESGPEQLAENLLKHAKRQVEEYAKSTVEADLALTSALTREQRKMLHEYIDKFELQHNTVGNGTDKRMIISRFKPFAAVTAAQAKEVIGSMVLKDRGANEQPLRGMVMEHRSETSKWRLQYDGEEELVDLDMLNVRLRRRAVADHGAGGLGGLGLPAAAGMDDPQLLRELLEGIDPDWEKKLPKYDSRHWMGNFTTILAVEKGTPAFNLFMCMISDALYWLLPGETARVRNHCEALGMSPEQIDKLKRKYWRRKCRYACPAPRLLLRAFHDVYVFFCGMLDPLKPGHQMLVPNHRHIFLKQMKYVQQGLLSDPPGMVMYLVVGFHPITRLARLRTLRNSSDLEGHFLHYSRALHPTAKAASGRNLHVRTNLFDFQWSLKAAAASGRMKDIGHSHPWLIDALADVCRGWLLETDLPSLLRQWKRTDTRREPCTFRGIDFELQDLRADAGGKGISISTLRSDADFIAVMRFPELVLRYDWPALARETGVYTNEKHLRDLVKRCFEKSLTEAALKERGLQQLLARLRATDGGTAPRALLPLATAPSTDLGEWGPLPTSKGVAADGTRQVEMRHDPGAAATAPELATAMSVSVSKAASTRMRTADSKAKRAQKQREKYAASRGEAYIPRSKARGAREGFQARSGKRQRTVTQPDGEVTEAS